MLDASVFSLTGDAGSIRSSSVKWTQFSTAARTASGDIRRIDSGDFVGDEADTYRDKLNHDLPPHLDTTSQAWSTVAGALQTYAATLENLQQRLATLAGQAQDQQSEVNSADNAVADAQTADSRHTTSVQAATKALKPGQILPPDTYQPQSTGASRELSSANSALQATTDAANQVHHQHTAALDACVNAINQAAGTRFEEPPGFWGHLKNSVTGWVADHADVLKSISSVLKTISGIAGLLALIPVLAPIMGLIALATGGAALLIDVTVKVVTGQGSWTGILVDGALLALPGAGRLLKGAVMATKTGQAVDRAAGTALNLAKDSRIGTAAAALRNSKVGNALVLPGKGLDWVNTKVAGGLRHIPGADRLPGVKVGDLGSPVPDGNSLPGTKLTPRAAAQAAVDRDPMIIARTRANPAVAARPYKTVATRRTVINEARRVQSGPRAGDIICARTGRPLPVVRGTDGAPILHDPLTHKPVTPPATGVTVPERGTYDLGHSQSHEWSYTRVQATEEGWTRAQIAAHQNDPGIYGIEAKGPNRAAGSDAHLSNLLPKAP